MAIKYKQAKKAYFKLNFNLVRELEQISKCEYKKISCPVLVFIELKYPAWVGVIL